MTTYKKKQTDRLLAHISEYCDGDPGKGKFKGNTYDFVLQEPEKNLWHEIRNEAIRYFNDSGIGFWNAGGSIQQGEKNINAQPLTPCRHKWPALTICLP